MVRSEVSLHEVKLYHALKHHSGWATSKHLAEISQLKARTIRYHLKRFVDVGICDLAEVFPAHRYRLSLNAQKRNKAFFLRLETAQDIFSEVLVTK